MSDQILVLDENGEDTGVVLDRDELHEKELPHDVVHIWIVSGGKLLIQFRSAKKSQYAGVWHISVAGHLEAGEDPREAAVREVAEEVGIEVAPAELVDLGREKVEQTAPETGLRDIEYVQEYLLRTEESVGRLQKSEVDSVRWIDIDEFEKEIIDPRTRKKYLNHPKDYYLQMVRKIRNLE